MPDDAPEEEPEIEKPRFLLPEGCKDLIDVIRLQQQREEHAEAERACFSISVTDASPEQPLPKSVRLPDSVTVGDLASALHLKPFKVICSLMELNVFASLNTKIDYRTARTVCLHYGVTAHRVA